MLRKKHHRLLFLANSLLFAFAILFDTTSLFDISIKSAVCLLVIPLLCAYSFFSSTWRCIAAGLICGIFIDSVSHNANCFNAVALMLLTVAVGFCSNNLFNKNIFSAAVLTLLASAVYFTLLWIFFYIVPTDMKSSLGYLLKYAFPSAVYTTVFSFPFYYIQKKFNDIME